jgi:hypothetical protein
VGAARWSVSAQKTAIDAQPAKRCVFSKTLCARARTGGAAQAQTSSASATTDHASTSVAVSAGPIVATVANAHSQAVPASAAPAWIPPT